MKKINVFWNGKKLCEMYPHATKFQVFKWKAKKFFRKLFITTTAIVMGCSMLVISHEVGRRVDPTVVYASTTVEVPVESDSPVMDRIAKCESGNMHYKNGQVIIRPNTNGTVDIGRYQINSVWNKKASELGLDLTKEKDNEVFAMWLYKNRGTNDWYSSASCWNK
jgi:hypothetical protein